MSRRLNMIDKMRIFWVECGDLVIGLKVKNGQEIKEEDAQEKHNIL
jgi:hypothetical protein